jgi:hypothetical protein
MYIVSPSIRTYHSFKLWWIFDHKHSKIICTPVSCDPCYFPRTRFEWIYTQNGSNCMDNMTTGNYRGPIKKLAHSEKHWTINGKESCELIFCVTNHDFD